MHEIYSFYSCYTVVQLAQLARYSVNSIRARNHHRQAMTSLNYYFGKVLVKSRRTAANLALIRKILVGFVPRFWPPRTRLQDILSIFTGLNFTCDASCFNRCYYSYLRVLVTRTAQHWNRSSLPFFDAPCASFQ